jgi:hypothetical protein
MELQIEVRFPVDPEAGKGFLRTGYIRRNDDQTIEFGVAKKDGFDYAWSVVPNQEFKAAVMLLFPELKFDA